MKGGFRQSMAWLHTWTGLMVGWLLFAVFLTGTLAYFRQEITVWMKPELHRAFDTPQAEALAVARLQILAPNAETWLIEPPDERDPVLQVFYRNPGERLFKRQTLDPATGEVLEARATFGGNFFYQFHYDLLMPARVGRWIVGGGAMIMFIAMISGIVTHRRIFRDFFTFRPRKAASRSWLDAHNALAVMALPYHLMITYTGLITLMYLYMPWGIDTVYQTRQEYAAEVFSIEPPGPASGIAAPLVAIDGPLAVAAERWQGGKVGRITINRPNDANATILLGSHEANNVARMSERLRFSGATGELIYVSPPDSSAIVTYSVLYGLHLGRFADPLLRWFFFISGIAGTAVVAAGLILWTHKRRPESGRPPFGFRLVETLNIGAITGLPIATAAYFWANRLLPADLAARSDWEIRCLFGVWLLAALHPVFRPKARAWVEQCWIAALLFTTLPLLNAATTKAHLGVTLPRGQWSLAGFDLTVLVTGALFATVAWALTRRAGRSRAAVAITSSPLRAAAE